MTRKQIEHKLKTHNLDPVERETLNQLLHHRIAQETSAKRPKKILHTKTTINDS